MIEGVVACPVHGDNETTPNCPGCRPYQFEECPNVVNHIYGQESIKRYVKEHFGYQPVVCKCGAYRAISV